MAAFDVVTNRPSVPDPLGRLVMSATYGTWRSGGVRGWVERGKEFRPPDPIRKRLRFTGLTILTLLGCGGEPETTTVHGRAMGTTWKLSVVHESSTAGATALQAAVAGRLEELEQQMSHWRAESPVSRFNRAAADEPFAISRDMAIVIAEAMSQWRATEGVLDVTVAPLVDLWGFGPAGRREALPNDAEISRARECVGAQHLTLDQSDATRPTLRKARAGVRLDLSCLVEGFAIDEIARMLDERGHTDYLFELGGELKARGAAPAGRAWQVGLEQPSPGRVGRVRRVVSLRDAALATSGNYRQSFRDPRDGRRYSHIIDPRTGCPVQHELVSVSVIASSAMRADAWATAIMVLGPDAGYDFAARQGIAATLVSESAGRQVEKWTPAFGLIAQLHTDADAAADRGTKH